MTTEIVRTFTYALDPNVSQVQGLASHCGAARFAYNHMLAVVKANMGQRSAEKTYGVPDSELTPVVSWSHYSLRKHWNSIKDVVAPWWGEVSKEAFSNGCANLATALKKWSDSRKGKGPKMGFPRFKSRHSRRSCTFASGVMRLTPDRKGVVLPRLGSIRTFENTRKLARLVDSGKARITQATVAEHRGRWRVALTVRITVAGEQKPHANPGSVVGVDLNAKDWIVAATPRGEEVVRVRVPNSLRKAERKLKQLQRKHRNKQSPDRRTGRRASNRWLKAKQQIAKQSHRVANIREDVLHKATTRLSREFETVVVEDLNVRGMTAKGGSRKRGLNRAVRRAAFAEIRRQLDYKTAKRGGKCVVADRFYPSSKTCSACGEVKAKLTLAEREYTCEICGVVLDRDTNAATNLALLAGSAPVTGRGAHIRPGADSSAAGKGDETSRVKTQAAHTGLTKQHV